MKSIFIITATASTLLALLLLLLLLAVAASSSIVVVIAERPPIEYLLDEDTANLTKNELNTRLDEFHSWFEGQYGQKLMVKVRKSEVDGMGMGVEALGRFREGQPYLSVPLKVCVDANTLTGPDAPPLFKEFWPYLKSRRDAPSQQIQLLLGTFLIYARWVAPNQTFWSSYINLLPRKVDTPEHTFTENDFSFLELFPRYVDKIKQNRKKREVEFYWMRDHVSKHATFKKLLPKKIFTRPRWSWAMAILGTRMIWWEGGPHLVPLLDMINCAVAPANKRWNIHETTREGDRAVTKAAYNIQKGDEIFENYGQHNPYYFLHHGFFLRFNPHDCYYVTLPRPERELTRKALFLTGARIEDGDQLCTNLGDGRKTKIIFDLARIYTLPDKVLETAIAKRQLPTRDTDRQLRRVIRWVGKRLKQKLNEVGDSEQKFAKRELDQTDAPHVNLIQAYIETLGIPINDAMKELRNRVKKLTERIKTREARWKREELEKEKREKESAALQAESEERGGQQDGEGDDDEIPMKNEDHLEDHLEDHDEEDQQSQAYGTIENDLESKKRQMSNKKTNIIPNPKQSSSSDTKNKKKAVKIDDDF